MASLGFPGLREESVFRQHKHTLRTPSRPGVCAAGVNGDKVGALWLSLAAARANTTCKLFETCQASKLRQHKLCTGSQQARQQNANEGLGTLIGVDGSAAIVARIAREDQSHNVLCRHI